MVGAPSPLLLRTHAPQKPRKYVLPSGSSRQSATRPGACLSSEWRASTDRISVSPLSFVKAARRGRSTYTEVIPMTRHSWHTLQVIKRAAAFRLRQLWAELSMLMSFFPDRRDAFDPDELPLDFILKRDSQTDPSATRLTPLPARACATSRATLAQAFDRRSGPTRRIPDE